MIVRDRRAVLALTLGLVCAVPGCGLFVAAGKMFWGDPIVPSYFTSATGVRLHKIQGKVLVYCTTPEAIKGEMGSLELDLADDAAREMERKGVRVVSNRDVSEYLEESGGIWGNASDMAEHFDEAEVIVHFDLGQFEYMEENSPNLFRGNVSGMMKAYKVFEDVDGRRRAQSVFQREFRTVFPTHVPIPVEQMTKRVFQAQLKDRIGKQLAQVFVDYRASEILR